MNRYWFVVAVILAVATVAPAADWVVLDTDADAYVSYDYRFPQEDENFGGEPDLNVWEEFTEFDHDIMRSFIHFDCGGLDPAGQVLEAVLSIYINRRGQGAYPIYVYSCNEAWDEYAITWNNQPPIRALLGSWSEIFPTGMYSDVAQLDTDGIESMVDNPDENFGIILWGVLDGNWAELSSREGGHPPQLKLLFSEADVQEASWGEIKASFD
jgi:hypothetical protein